MGSNQGFGRQNNWRKIDKWTDIAFINRLIDKVIKNIETIFDMLGYKNALPNYEHSIVANILGLFDMGIVINLTEGAHTTEPKIKRSPTIPTTVTRNHDELVIKISLEIDSFKFTYDISINATVYCTTGIMLGNVKGTKLNIEISLDEDFKLDLKSFKMAELGNIHIQFDNDSIGTRFANSRVPEIIENIREDQSEIFKQIEEQVLLIVPEKLRAINSMFI